MKPLYIRYKDIKPCGVCSYNAFFGLMVFEPLQEDKYSCDFITAWHNGEHGYNYSRNKVHYTSSGRPFLRKGSLRIYFDEIMRTNY